MLSCDQCGGKAVASTVDEGENINGAYLRRDFSKGEGLNH
jgi:hypothetical protein